MILKLSDIMIAKQESALGINATGKCGCSSSNSNCGSNNFSSTGTQVASQCGANYIAADNPNFKNNK